MTSPEQYTPRNISELDYIAAAKRTADAILRSNPLTNAVVSKGLMRWVGNHVDANGDLVNFLWIGDFLPADTSMGGILQKGIVMWRDDSTSTAVNDGRMAFALYDHNPGGDGLGLRQTLHIVSLDGAALLNESRHGGQRFPHAQIPMGDGAQTNRAKWPSLTGGAFQTLLEGYTSVVGKHLYARYWTHTDAGTTGEFKLTASHSGGSFSGVTFAQAANTVVLREDTIDVSSARGVADLQVKIEARVTGGAGFVAGAPISFRNYTNVP